MTLSRLNLNPAVQRAHVGHASSLQRISLSPYNPPTAVLRFNCCAFHPAGDGLFAVKGFCYLIGFTVPQSPDLGSSPRAGRVPIKIAGHEHFQLSYALFSATYRSKGSGTDRHTHTIGVRRQVLSNSGRSRRENVAQIPSRRLFASKIQIRGALPKPVVLTARCRRQWLTDLRKLNN